MKNIPILSLQNDKLLKHFVSQNIKKLILKTFTVISADKIDKSQKYILHVGLENHEETTKSICQHIQSLKKLIEIGTILLQYEEDDDTDLKKHRLTIRQHMSPLQMINYLSQLINDSIPTNYSNIMKDVSSIDEESFMNEIMINTYQEWRTNNCKLSCGTTNRIIRIGNKKIHRNYPLCDFCAKQQDQNTSLDSVIDDWKVIFDTDFMFHE